MMQNPKTLNKQRIDRWLSLRLFCCAVACILWTGCRQRAYTELYVENMASEIRMLEDRIYEYDAAYMEKDSQYDRLVQEVDRLKKLNMELQRDAGMKQPLSGSSRKSTPQNNSSNGLLSIEPPKPRATETYQAPSILSPDTGKPEVIENPPVVSKTPVGPPPIGNKNPKPDVKEFLPADEDSSLPPPILPKDSKRLPEMRGANPNEPQASSNNRSPNRNSNLPSIDDLTEEVSMPDSLSRSAQQPRLMPAPTQPASPIQLDGSSPSAPPSLLQRAFPKLKEGDSQGAIQRGMIRLPEGSKVQFASANEPIEKNVPKIIDDKIVDIAFHPTLCRGHNFDDRPGDDGLYLVVTPVNASGQVLNQTGTLTIIVEDPDAPKSNGRIAAWEFTPEQLQETLEPIGSSQGFHLSLPWQDKTPTGKVVAVYLRFSNSLGRTLVNHRDLHLRVPTTEQAVWTPRKTATAK